MGEGVLVERQDGVTSEGSFEMGARVGALAMKSGRVFEHSFDGGCEGFSVARGYRDSGGGLADLFCGVRVGVHGGEHGTARGHVADDLARHAGPATAGGQRDQSDVRGRLDLRKSFPRLERQKPRVRQASSGGLESDLILHRAFAHEEEEDVGPRSKPSGGIHDDRGPAHESNGSGIENDLGGRGYALRGAPAVHARARSDLVGIEPDGDHSNALRRNSLRDHRSAESLGENDGTVAEAVLQLFGGSSDGDHGRMPKLASFDGDIGVDVVDDVHELGVPGARDEATENGAGQRRSVDEDNVGGGRNRRGEGVSDRLAGEHGSASRNAAAGVNEVPGSDDLDPRGALAALRASGVPVVDATVRMVGPAGADADIPAAARHEFGELADHDCGRMKFGWIDLGGDEEPHDARQTGRKRGRLVRWSGLKERGAMAASSDRPWFMCVAAGLLQVPLIRAAQALGFRVVAIDRNAAAPGMSVADVAEAIDIIDLPRALEVARRHRIVGVAAAACEPAMPTVAGIVEALGLHGPSVEAVRNATNKERMRTAFVKAGIAVPQFRAARNLGEAQEAAQDIGFPVIVKPVDSSGSRGVSRVERPEDLPRAVEHALAVSSRMLVEEYLEGPELSVESLTFGGQTHVVVLSDKSITPWPYPVEDGQAQPSTVPPDTWREASELAVAGIRALGIDESASHTEIKVTPHGCRIVEIGARQAGDFMGTFMTSYSVGVDMNRAVVQIAAGLKIDPPIEPRRQQGIAVRYLLPAPGLVRSIEVPREIREDPAVVDWAVYVRPGDRVRRVTSSLDRAGHVLAVGRDTGMAVAKAERACRAIRIVTA